MSDAAVEQNYLEMSDEDILKMAAPAVAAAPAETAEETEAREQRARDAAGRFVSTTPAVEGAAADDAGDQDEEEQDAAEDTTGAAGDSQAAEVEADATAKESEGEQGNEGNAGAKTGEQPAATEAKPAADEPAAVDYKAAYERITAPFKANGRDIQVKSVDDAIALMQMGANYQKKMAALKPNLKLLKALENNDLLSEEKLGFLIDLSRKDPGAIQKLVSESGIDPMEFDAEKAKAYRQNTYAVDDREIELDTVLDELKDSPTYTRTLGVVSNKWDRRSKEVIREHPQLLSVIDSHVASGIYDIISNAVEQERILGRLKGVSDLEAYRLVGDSIQAKGGFNHLAPAQPGQGQAKPAAPAVVAPKPKPVANGALNDKRRAASSTKPAAPSSTFPADFNPLAMSDEEISRMTAPKFS